MSAALTTNLTVSLKRQQHDGVRSVPTPPAPCRDHLNAMFAKLSARSPNEVAPRHRK